MTLRNLTIVLVVLYALLPPASQANDFFSWNGEGDFQYADSDRVEAIPSDESLAADIEFCNLTPDEPGVYFRERCWNWTESLELFAGLDGSKQPQDFGVNAQFGGRMHANWAMPISHDYGIGLQVGTAVSQAHHAVAVTHAIEGSTRRTQSFTTAGIFQRTETGWTWALVDDFLYQEDYDSTALMQLRGRVGYDLNGRDEIGVFGMAPLIGADASWAGNPVHLRPLAQGSLFWRHTWDFGGQTTGWLGMSERHGQANIALGDRSQTNVVPVFGSDLHLPLNDHWAIYGEANFVTPADTGTVDAFLGFAYYPAGGAVLWRKRAFSPVLPVASSPSMSVNLTR